MVNGACASPTKGNETANQLRARGSRVAGRGSQGGWGSVEAAACLQVGPAGTRPSRRRPSLLAPGERSSSSLGWEPCAGTGPLVLSSRLSNLNHAWLQAPTRPAGPRAVGRAPGRAAEELAARSGIGILGPSEPQDPRTPSPGGGGRGLIDSSDVSAVVVGWGGAAREEGGRRRRELRPQSAASEIKGPFHSRDVSGPEGEAGCRTLTQRPASEPRPSRIPRTRACCGPRAAGASACSSAVRVSVGSRGVGVCRAWVWGCQESRVRLQGPGG